MTSIAGLQLYSTVLIHQPTVLSIMHACKHQPLPNSIPPKLPLTSQTPQILIHLKRLSTNDINPIMPFPLHRLPLLVRHAPPAALLARVLDPLHGREVVVVLLHCDDPGHVVEGHCFETEICFICQRSSRLECKREGQKGRERKGNVQVLSGMPTTAFKKLSRSGVGLPFTCVMKFVGARPY
jgi:hypothetical protein